MRHTIRLVLGLALVLCAGTALAQPPVAIRDSDYYPLAKGTKWTYKTGDNLTEVRVAKVEKVNNEDQYLLEVTGGGATATEMMVVRTDGVYRTQVREQPLVSAGPAVVASHEGGRQVEGGQQNRRRERDGHARDQK